MPLSYRSISTLTFGSLLFLSACGKNSGNNKNALLSPEAAQCAEQFQPSPGGKPIAIEGVVTKQVARWKLQSVEMFQALKAKDKDVRMHIGGSFVDLDKGLGRFKKSCGGNNSELDATFRFSIPREVYTQNGLVRRKHFGKIVGNPSDVMSYYAEAGDGNGENIVPDKLPEVQASVRYWGTPANRIEIWWSAPMSSADSEGLMILKSQYVLVDNTPMELFAEAFEYAQRGSYKGGLGLPKKEAQEFADMVSKMGEPGYSYLDNYKMANAYGVLATYEDGLGLPSSAARAFAEVVASNGKATEVFNTFKKYFKYAYKASYEGGMGLRKVDALNFASQKSGLDLQFK